MTKKLNILVVDDDKDLVDSLADVLIDEGYSASKAFDGKEAMSKAGESFFDLILMDIKMPTMNGVETYKNIKKISPRTMVIMMTGYSVSELISEALKEGAHGILYKPIDIKHLLQTISTIKEGGGLIMIVDNEEATFKHLKGVLEQNGYLVNWATDAKQALEMSRFIPKDIVFIECFIPLLNGLELYEELKIINPKIVAIMMTADKYKSQKIIEKAIEEGAYTCLYKPFDVKEALTLVKEITKKKKK